MSWSAFLPQICFLSNSLSQYRMRAYIGHKLVKVDELLAKAHKGKGKGTRKDTNYQPMKLTQQWAPE